MPQTILITGASSGLGLAFLQHYSSLTPTPSIIALDTSPLPPSIPPSQTLSFFQTDITSPTALQSIQSSLPTTPITLLIHSAGIRGLVPHIAASLPGDAAPAESWAAMDQHTFMRTLEINTWGAFNVLSTFLPNLRLAPSSSSMEPAKAVVMSSRMGSVGANTAGGGYAYRASKAGLNAVVRSFAIDVPEVAFLMLHPGRVETGLVAWREEGAVGVQESVGDCLRVIEGLGREGSGRLVDRFGEVIPW